MIILELNRIAALTPKKGDIFVNEHGQKFRVNIATDKALFSEPYEGKKPATFFGYTGQLNQESE